MGFRDKLPASVTLIPEKDPAAIVALQVYAALTDNRDLAEDLQRHVGTGPNFLDRLTHMVEDSITEDPHEAARAAVAAIGGPLVVLMTLHQHKQAAEQDLDTNFASTLPSSPDTVRSLRATVEAADNALTAAFSDASLAGAARSAQLWRKIADMALQHATVDDQYSLTAFKIRTAEARRLAESLGRQPVATR